MSAESTLEFAARPGRLRGPAELVFALVAHAAGGADVPVDELDAALEAAGAGSSADPHAALARTLEPLAEKLVAVELERGDVLGSMWITPSAATLLSPLEDGRAQLVSVPPTMVPAALVRFFGLGPRPRPEGASAVAMAPADLASAIATGQVGRGVPQGPGRTVLEESLAGVRSHWRATAEWLPAPGVPGVRRVEVVDTDAGMWLVVPDDPTIELWPTTPTTVAVQLCGLLPRDEELDWTDGARSNGARRQQP